MTSLRLACLFLVALVGIDAAPALAGPDARVRTVVLGVSARRGIKDKALVAALSTVVLSAYAEDPRRLVIGPDDIARALDWEATRQQAGCTESACLAEVGAALDAARLVNGTLDAIGGVYLLGLTEIDARTLEPVGRVQEEVKRDETALLEATRRLGRALASKAPPTPPTMATPTSPTTPRDANGVFAADAGSIEISSDPAGAEVHVGEHALGVTPTRIDNLTTGRHPLRLVRQGYESVSFEAPVFAGGTTKVTAELPILRALAEQNIAVRNARWREESERATILGWSAGVAGVVGVGVGGVLAVSALRSPGLISIPGLLGLSLGALGAAGIVGGITALSARPPRPVPEWELKRQIVVTPPAGHGPAEASPSRKVDDARPATPTTT